MSTDNPTVTCTRCRRTAAAAQGVTWGGQLGEEIRSRVCDECWQEWQKAEVMVINELRLDFMDPESQPTLIRHLREFLALGEAAG